MGIFHPKYTIFIYTESADIGNRLLVHISKTRGGKHLRSCLHLLAHHCPPKVRKQQYFSRLTHSFSHTMASQELISHSQVSTLILILYLTTYFFFSDCYGHHQHKKMFTCYIICLLCFRIILTLEWVLQMSCARFYIFLLLCIFIISIFTSRADQIRKRVVEWSCLGSNPSLLIPLQTVVWSQIT